MEKIAEQQCSLLKAFIQNFGLDRLLTTIARNPSRYAAKLDENAFELIDNGMIPRQICYAAPFEKRPVVFIGGTKITPRVWAIEFFFHEKSDGTIDVRLGSYPKKVCSDLLEHLSIGVLKQFASMIPTEERLIYKSDAYREIVALFPISFPHSPPISVKRSLICDLCPVNMRGLERIDVPIERFSEQLAESFEAILISLKNNPDAKCIDICFDQGLDYERYTEIIALLEFLEIVKT